MKQYVTKLLLFHFIKIYEYYDVIYTIYKKIFLDIFQQNIVFIKIHYFSFYNLVLVKSLYSINLNN